MRFHTSARSAGDADVPIDGPIGELLVCLKEIFEDDAQLQELAKELSDLRKKLPQDLVHGEDAVAFDDPVELRRKLMEVEPLLLSRLKEGC